LQLDEFGMCMADKSIHIVARLGLAFVFAYHGLVPKLLTHHRDEIAMLRDVGASAERANTALTAFGIGEVAFAFCLLLYWRRRWPLCVCIAAMCLGTIGVMISSPRFITAAFNPVSLNTAVACLAAIDLLVLKSKEAE
jgi:uncharacterized membrane protein YphA (DoxX/SURF4 family)